MIAKRPTPGINVLTTRERILLFCIVRSTSSRRVDVTSEVVTTLIKEVFSFANLALADDGRAALRALSAEP